MQESQGKIEFRTVVAAIDLQFEPAMRALKFASALAADRGARLVIAHAFPSLEGVVGENFDPNWRTYFRDVAVEEIEKFKKEAGLAAGDAIVEPGDPARVVAGIAEREKADLVVIGRGSAGGVFGRLRANAYAIIRQTPCPVISV
jgi:nucleotide-binding universal stress UspA family protein